MGFNFEEINDALNGALSMFYADGDDKAANEVQSAIDFNTSIGALELYGFQHLHCLKIHCDAMLTKTSNPVGWRAAYEIVHLANLTYLHNFDLTEERLTLGLDEHPVQALNVVESIQKAYKLANELEEALSDVEIQVAKAGENTRHEENVRGMAELTRFLLKDKRERWIAEAREQLKDL